MAEKEDEEEGGGGRRRRRKRQPRRQGSLSLPTVHRARPRVHFSVRLIAAVVFKDVLHCCDREHKQERYRCHLLCKHLHSWYEAEDDHQQEVYVSITVKLLKEVLGQESEQGVFSGADGVAVRRCAAEDEVKKELDRPRVRVRQVRAMIAQQPISGCCCRHFSLLVIADVFAVTTGTACTCTAFRHRPVLVLRHGNDQSLLLSSLIHIKRAVHGHLSKSRAISESTYDKIVHARFA